MESLLQHGLTELALNWSRGRGAHSKADKKPNLCSFQGQPYSSQLNVTTWPNPIPTLGSRAWGKAGQLGSHMEQVMKPRGTKVKLVQGSHQSVRMGEPGGQNSAREVSGAGRWSSSTTSGRRPRRILESGLHRHLGSLYAALGRACAARKDHLSRNETSDATHGLTTFPERGGLCRVHFPWTNETH